MFPSPNWIRQQTSNLPTRKCACEFESRRERQSFSGDVLAMNIIIKATTANTKAPFAAKVVMTTENGDAFWLGEATHQTEDDAYAESKSTVNELAETVKGFMQSAYLDIHGD